MYNVAIQHLYTLQGDHHNKLVTICHHLSLSQYWQYFLFCVLDPLFCLSFHFTPLWYPVYSQYLWICFCSALLICFIYLYILDSSYKWSHMVFTNILIGRFDLLIFYLAFLRFFDQGFTRLVEWIEILSFFYYQAKYICYKLI